jgi:hypothetical protein
MQPAPAAPLRLAEYAPRAEFDLDLRGLTGHLRKSKLTRSRQIVEWASSGHNRRLIPPSVNYYYRKLFPAAKSCAPMSRSSRRALAAKQFEA